MHNQLLCLVSLGSLLKFSPLLRPNNPNKYHICLLANSTNSMNKTCCLNVSPRIQKTFAKRSVRKYKNFASRNALFTFVEIMERSGGFYPRCAFSVYFALILAGPSFMVLNRIRQILRLKISRLKNNKIA